MKTITKIQKYGLKRFIAGKSEIIGNAIQNFDIFSKLQNIKKDVIEDVCSKLKNDLKWYQDDGLNSNSTKSEKYFQEKLINKGFSEKTASKLVEEWWLSS